MGFHKCSCGVEHDVPVYIDQYIEELGPNVPIETPAGRWYVPRVYVAHHGIAARDIPELAKKYGWEPADDAEHAVQLDPDNGPVA